MRLFILSLVALALLVPMGASAQEDVTAPVLLEFSISPVVFDAGPGPVTLDFCISARDDLSGLRLIVIIVGQINDVARSQFPAGTLDGEFCGQITVPQFFPYGPQPVLISLSDQLQNDVTYLMGDNPDLCLLPAPCEVVNRQSGGLPDSDNDGIPDDSDNCPDDFNDDQADTDLDLIGDICDPFPDDRDNEQAQCNADLADAQFALDQCLALPTFDDADGDGEDDATDACPGTLLTAPVDTAGCSQAQFCAQFDPSSPDGRRDCGKADWLNDEPSGGPAKDCVVDKKRDGGPACVAR